MLNNRDRFIVKILREVAEPLGIAVDLFCSDWVIRLRKGAVTRFVMGYTFDLNTAATRSICNDKVATSDLLADSGVPCVEHRLFLRPELWRYVDSSGNWQAMLAMLEGHGRLVVKPNEGSGGKGVMLVTQPRELEAAVHELFATERGIALGAYHEIQREVRFLILDGVVELAYAKSRPTLVGDGRSTILQLLATGAEGEAATGRMLKLLRHLGPAEEQSLSRVPGEGEIVLGNWKHNLGGGGTAEAVDEASLGDLAIAAANAVNLRFGAVDVIETADGAMVLEVNSGAMIEHYVRDGEGDERYEQAKRIYARALGRMFGLGEAG